MRGNRQPDRLVRRFLDQYQWTGAPEELVVRLCEELLEVHIRASDSPERQRFTICHETLHTFFPGFQEERRRRADTTVGTYDRNQLEEYLCDLGAAELLLPRQPFLAALPAQPSIDDVIDLATTFTASLEATALRIVNLVTVPMALVVLEPAWKPAERRELVRRATQPALVGLERRPPPKKLRVR